MLLVCYGRAWPQEGTFQPLKLYSSKSKELIDELTTHLGDEYRYLGTVTNKTTAQQICNSRSSLILKLVRAKAFVDNDSIDAVLESIVNRIVGSNGLERRKRMVLVTNSPEVNATCFGRGTFMVTIGLLSRVSTEDELAFVLSHELAHDELRHVQFRIREEADQRTARKMNTQFGKILFGEITIDDIEAFRKFVYKASEFSRGNEIEADSLGFLLYHRAMYNDEQAVALLSMLDSAGYPKYDYQEAFFSPFDFAKYPFKDYWLNDRLSVYKRKGASSFLYSSDSLESHPDMDLRMDQMRGYLESAGPCAVTPTAWRPDIVYQTEFQTVESAYVSLQYDQALFHSLQLMKRYPGNTYLVSRVGKMLLDISEAKNDMLFEKYVSRFTGRYKERMQQVNNFLYNITGAEVSELAFHFMNNQSNFSSGEPSHYYLLWKICLSTHRDQVAEKIEKKFRDTFKKSIATFDYE